MPSWRGHAALDASPINSSSVDHQSVVTENQAALQATLDFGFRKLGPAKWEPAPASEAAAELASEETRPGGDPWGRGPAPDGLRGREPDDDGRPGQPGGPPQLLDDKMSVIGPTVVARSAIEISSGVWWLMEPGIGARAPGVPRARAEPDERPARQAARRGIPGHGLRRQRGDRGGPAAGGQGPAADHRSGNRPAHLGLLARDRERRGQGGHLRDGGDAQGGDAGQRPGHSRSTGRTRP